MSRFRTIETLSGAVRSEELLDVSRVVRIRRGAHEYAILVLDTGAEITTTLPFKDAAAFIEGEP